MNVQRLTTWRRFLRRRRTARRQGWLSVGGLLAGCLMLSGCGISMYDQPKYEPYEYSDFFADGRSARTPPDGTVAHVAEQPTPAVETGQVDGKPVDTMPVPVTRDLLQRGQQRFNIYCAPCHGFSGYGNGEIVQRGFPHPPSFHSERIRALHDGEIFNVITNGYGVMYPYGYRVAPLDRWAIIAYIRALQLSQNATLDDVPGDQQSNIQGAGK